MLFAVTGLTFWLLFLIAIVCLFISVATESSWWGLLIIICFLSSLWVFGYKGNVQGIWGWITENPLRLIIYFLFYILLGIAYSFVKWYLFLSDRKEEMLRRRKEYDNIIFYGIPQIQDYKGKLFGWIFYWSLGVIWDMIDRPFRRLFKFIYERISGSYQRISDKMFANITGPKK